MRPTWRAERNKECNRRIAIRKSHMQTVIQSIDDTTAMDSLRPAQCGTCTVIDRQMS